MNDARIPVWASLYDRSIANITQSDEGAEYAGVDRDHAPTAQQIERLAEHRWPAGNDEP